MNKNLFILTSLMFLYPSFVFGQYRIELDKKNTYVSGSSYLIDVPLSVNMTNLHIDNTNGIIPIDLLLFTKRRIWNNLSTLIITNKPDLTDSNQYIVAQSGPIIKAKSIDRKYLKYKRLYPVVKNNADSVVIYYDENYGSACCPRASIWDMPNISDFIKEFEANHKANIGTTYFLNQGKEGEHTTYYTLDGLSPAQKIDFLVERWYSMIPNKETKDMGPPRMILMPFWTKTKDLKIIK